MVNYKNMTIGGIGEIMPLAQRNAGHQKRKMIKYGKYNSEYGRARYFAAVHLKQDIPR